MIIESPILEIPLAFNDSLWSDLLQQLLTGHSLTVPQAADLMQGWLTDTIPPVLSGAILTAINVKGVSSAELLGMVQVLYAQSIYPERHLSLDIPLIDTCGTGGDRASTFNISTAVAFVAAAAGVKVAKHGNRSASSKTGSADVLEALGVNLHTSTDKSVAAVDEVGITFLFAQNWHPALKNVAILRKTLKIRTIFNLLGPLINPLQPTGQVIGVSDRSLIAPFADVLCQLGIRRGIVLHGREKLDEAGLADLTDLAIVCNRQIHNIALDPQALGIKSFPTTALCGGSVTENAQILAQVLQGKGTQAQQEVVALNTALALFVGEAIPDGVSYFDTFVSALTQAREVLRSGEPWRKLEQLSQFLM
jgi:anthranilate phosphoribosyltransferase